MIGTKTIEKAKELVSDLLNNYREKIDETYIKSEAGILIGFKLNIVPNDRKPGFIDIEAKINFITSKVKDSATATISEIQAPLFRSAGNQKSN